MRKQIFSRIAIAGCLILAAALLATWSLTPPARAQAEPEQATQENNQLASYRRRSEEPKITTRPVVVFSDNSVVVPASGTMLVRTRDNVFATMHTSGLTPGTVVTFWWAFFNNPRHCATRSCTPADLANPAVQGSVVSGGGRIIGADGTATFGAFRRVGDTTGVFTGLGTVQGLLEPLRAQIHLVTRTHGPANMSDPELLRQQLSLFNGGCPPNTCANLQASIHQP